MLDPNAANTMAGALEPQLAGRFSSLVRDHGAFILGFEEGRDLVERADRFAIDTILIAAIGVPGNALLNELTDNSDLVDEATRREHSPVRDAVIQTGWGASRSGYSAYLIVRKAVLAIINLTIGQAKTPGEIAAILLSLSVGGSVVLGDPNVEFIRAAVPVLRDQGANLLSFFNHSPEFRAYVEWALNILDGDHKARNKTST
ncbi:MAG: hypothetical protein ACTSSQ_03755 [Alphaproteobacteria bacterium]